MTKKYDKMKHPKTLMLIFMVICLVTFNVLSQRKVFNFQQSDYKIQFERVELDHYSEKYVNYVKFVTFKYNRTSPVVNATFNLKVTFGTKLQVLVQAYKFLSNEYRLFPLRFEVNACDALRNNLIGVADLFKCGNFTGCPFRKDTTYHFCNWAISESHFPPFLPEGKYKIEISGLYKGEDVGSVFLFISAFRPIRIL